MMKQFIGGMESLSGLKVLGQNLIEERFERRWQTREIDLFFWIFAIRESNMSLENRYAEAKFNQDYQAARDATSYYDIDDGTSG